MARKSTGPSAMSTPQHNAVRSLDSTTTSTTARTSSDSTNESADEQEEQEGEADNADDKAPSSAFKGIKLSEPNDDDPSDGDDNTTNASEEEFDIPDDDEDYDGLDLISISSGDLNVQHQESTFIEDALRAESDWNNELETSHSALAAHIDWNDRNTYQETPRSGLYDDLMPAPEVDAASPLSHVQQNSPFQDSTHMLLYKDADPALQRPLFGQGESGTVDFFDGSSSSSSTSSSASSPRPVVQQAEDSMSQSADSLSVASQDDGDSDTEDEDFTVESAERARRIELRKKLERRRKQKHTPKTIKLRPKSSEEDQRFDVMKNFRINPRQTAAWTQTTPRGNILRFYEPRHMNKLRIKWVIGRTRPTPVDTTPMSAAYTLAMQSSMFRLLHCPNSPSLSFQRDRRARASHFGSNLMLHSPGLLPVPSSLGRLSIEYGEATEEDIADLFLDLDNKTDDGNELDFTPASNMQVDDDFASDGLSLQTPSPLPRFQVSDESRDTQPDTPVTPTSRPRKRTLDNEDGDEDTASSPTKRLRPESNTAGIITT